MKSDLEVASQARLANVGTVVSVRGSVVDVRFDDRLPSIYSVLRTGEERQIVIEVLAQRDAHHVRGIALTPAQGLARGMTVEDTGGPLKAPVGKGGAHVLASLRIDRALTEARERGSFSGHRPASIQLEDGHYGPAALGARSVARGEERERASSFAAARALRSESQLHQIAAKS